MAAKAPSLQSHSPGGQRRLLLSRSSSQKTFLPVSRVSPQPLLSKIAQATASCSLVIPRGLLMYRRPLHPLWEPGLKVLNRLRLRNSPIGDHPLQPKSVENSRPWPNLAPEDPTRVGLSNPVEIRPTGHRSSVRTRLTQFLDRINVLNHGRLAMHWDCSYRI